MAKRKRKERAAKATVESLPHQTEVYFATFPELDYTALARFVDACEPGQAEPCEIHEVGDDEEEDSSIRVDAFAAFVGGMTIGTLIHSFPTKGIELIRRASMAPALRDEILKHEAYALLTLVGGDDLPAIDRTLFMYKMAAGMCMQGAVGIGNIHTGRVLPGGAIREIFGKPRGDLSTWELMRDFGEPPQLLMSVEQLEINGRRFLATCGLGYCGLPDLAWEYTNARDSEAVLEMFQNCFRYMMENGPVIGPGHTVGYDENVAFRFDRLPKGMTLPYPVESVLVMTKVGASG
ncbi:MAG: DUF4261 domain-containing protein [Planctomycetes bacterium]|nr:DUF4261 domain-containing protein [Planctomycetota bacterium]